MANQTIGLPVDDVGKKLDTEELLVSAVTVQRERIQIAGAADIEIVRVLDTDPAGDDHGLVVRVVPGVAPKVDFSQSVGLGPGSTADLDASTIAAGTLGKLQRVLVSSAVPCKWEVKTRDGGVEVVRAVLMTSGVTGGTATWDYEPKDRDGITLAGAGVDENFRVTVENLGSQAHESSDVHATIEWDEG